MRRALLAAGIVLAACGESRLTGPSKALDLDATGRASATMGSMVGSGAMAGIAALGGRMPAELVATTSRAGVPVDAAAGVSAIALQLLKTLPGAAGPLAVQAIRPAVLGHTYIYDPAAHRYVHAPSRSGAPGNGVRFILYAVDPETHEPVVSQETGYADLTDEGAPGFAVALRLRAVSGGKTFLDYGFTLGGTLAGGSLTVSGFLADDLNRIDFTIASQAVGLGSLQAAHVAFELSLPSQRFHATGSIAATTVGSAGSAHVDVTVTIGSDSIRLLGETTGAGVSATLAVNGRLFATIMGDPAHPTIRGDGGRELSAAEGHVLGALVGVVYGSIEMFEDLLEPVAAILGISVSL